MVDGWLRMAEQIEAKDLRGSRNTNLVDAVPLDTPWTMFIEPTNACDFRCKFCPTGHLPLLAKAGRKVAMMDFKLYTSVIDDLKFFPQKLKMLNLYKDGESLLHPRFIEMVRYAKQSRVSEKIWLKTNGNNLSFELNNELATCGLDMIGISAFTEQGFWDIAGTRVDYQQYRANIKDLHGRGVPISVKVADTGLTEKEKRTFLDDFTDICDYITIEGLHGWSASDTYDWKLGTDQSFDGTERTKKIACPLVMYMLTISANGDISICNDDFAHYHQLGNAEDKSINDIWNGEKLKSFRRMHLNGLRHVNPACDSCDYMEALPDTIDQHLDLLKGKLDG